MSHDVRQYRIRRLIPRQRRKSSPFTDDPAEAFAPQRGTRWLEPRLLLRSALSVVISAIFAQYNDKREQMGTIAAANYLDLSQGHDEVWVDYVADTGDGFNATYAVAALLARDELKLSALDGRTHSTRRGRLLVMGGDQVYPSAAIREYDQRLIGPYRAALPRVEPEEDAPYLQAVPGNHDWYDGLTAFMRTFCQNRWIGGWRSWQARSYFATRLPGRWWVWGIDIQFDSYIDAPQLHYFKEIAKHLEPGDGIVLCTAKPSWVAATDEDCEAYATLDFFEREVVGSIASVRVALSGDRHHYARFAAENGAQKITAGGGGAYLSPTHHLPSPIIVPPEASRAHGKSFCTSFTRCTTFPDERSSRRLGWGILRLPFLTPTFAGLLGSTYALLALALGAALAPPAQGLGHQLSGWADALRDAGPAQLAGGLVGSFSALTLALLVVAAAMAFTKKTKSLKGVLLGGVHGLLHLALTVLTTWGAAALVEAVPGAWMLIALVPLVRFSQRIGGRLDSLC